jgi:hypothetical protein
VDGQTAQRQLGVQREALDEAVERGGRETDETPKARGPQDPDDL